LKQKCELENYIKKNLQHKKIESTEENIADLLDLANEELDKNSKIISEVIIVLKVVISKS
jgi:hypothetical protein